MKSDVIHGELIIASIGCHYCVSASFWEKWSPLTQRNYILGPEQPLADRKTEHLPPKLLNYIICLLCSDVI